MNDLAMMKAIDRWPLYPVLPVKKRDPDGGLPQTGIIFAAQGMKEDILRALDAAEEPAFLKQFDQYANTVFIDADLSRLGSTVKVSLPASIPTARNTIRWRH
jgi:hypothetical protein